MNGRGSGVAEQVFEAFLVLRLSTRRRVEYLSLIGFVEAILQ
ncbi:hypothetical protein [Yokenella regensburgei]